MFSICQISKPFSEAAVALTSVHTIGAYAVNFKKEVKSLTITIFARRRFAKVYYLKTYLLSRIFDEFENK